MKLYIEGRVPPDVLALAARLGAIIKELPEFDLGMDARCEPVLVSCHMLTRAFAKLFPGLHVIDGSFGAVDHSWLFLRASDRSRWIIDVYPVGIVASGPLIVDFCVPGLSCVYDSERKPIFPEGTPDFEWAVTLLLEAAQAINDTLPPLT